MAHISRLLPMLVLAWTSFAATAAQIWGQVLFDVEHTVAEVPPIFDTDAALFAEDMVNGRPDGGGSMAGAMFSERSRSHALFIGDGFTLAGRALPI